MFVICYGGNVICYYYLRGKTCTVSHRIEDNKIERGKDCFTKKEQWLIKSKRLVKSAKISLFKLQILQENFQFETIFNDWFPTQPFIFQYPNVLNLYISIRIEEKKEINSYQRLHRKLKNWSRSNEQIRSNVKIEIARSEENKIASLQLICLVFVIRTIHQKHLYFQMSSDVHYLPIYLKLLFRRIYPKHIKCMK